MSNAQPEPSMEEILASIRRIISEDEEDSKSAAPEPRPATVHRPPPAARPEPVPAASGAEAEPSRQSGAKSETESAKEPIEMTRQNFATITENDQQQFLEETASEVTAKAFQSLSQSVRISRSEGLTLEDIVTELVRPLIKEWLDANLPGIVEDKVEEEIQRLARRR